ncbi:MAG: ferredoxin [Patescibacteria group bacterium]|jgi:ferredoxin
MPKLKVDKEKCIGCGTCVSLAPKIFELDDDGKSKVKDGEAQGSEVEEAISSCPVQAISIEKEK